MADLNPQNPDLIWSKKVASIAISTCVVAKALPTELAERCIEIAAEEIQALREEIRRHEHLYYVLDAPALTDAQYDAVRTRLDALLADAGALEE